MANYNTKEIREKFTNALREAIEDVKAGKVTSVSISKGNVKMGAVPSVSLLPLLTCPAICNHTCGKDCYASKIANLRKSVLTSYARNTALLMVRPDLYWFDVKRAMMINRFFRFHVSGDIPNREYFNNLVNACKENSHCKTLVFTKRFDIVNSWIDENGDLPENLHILFSGWQDMKPENPHNLPETNVYEKNEEPQEDWLLCGGNCFECGCRGVGCWQAKKGDVIAFKKH